jgi:hypothetical protein
MCVLNSSVTFVWNISYSKKNWARYDQKCQVAFRYSNRYSFQILMKSEFSGKFFFPKNTQISNFMKICPVGAELFPCGQIEGRAERRTDMTKLRVAFRNLANAPKNALLNRPRTQI